MTWTAFHRRSDVLRSVVTELDRRLDGTLPTDVPGVAETFRDDLDLVGALQLRWHTRLSGRIERRLAEGDADARTAVVLAWAETAADLPGLRAVLDEQARTGDDATRAALAVATSKERAALALHAGLAGADAGAVLETQARTRRDVPRIVADPRPGGFLHRLRAAVAAA